MKLDQIVAWYQKKIGTYDKQQWEKTVEQKILNGFNSVTLKTAKLKTELIDVDLVRGSTFPKAKPKQSLLTVIRLAILRYLFLPVYAQWWVKQTSPNIFGMLLFMYITQMINWAVYTYNIHRLDQKNIAANSPSIASKASTNITHSSTSSKQFEEHIVSISELLIPMVLSLLLSLIHSQIVATNTASGAKTKRRRFSNTNAQNSKSSRGETRVRRRKKPVKVRSHDLLDGGIQLQQQPQQPQLRTSFAKQCAGIEVIKKVNVESAQMCSNAMLSTTCNNGQQEVFNTSSVIRNITYKSTISKTPTTKLKLDLINDAAMSNADAFTLLHEGGADAYSFADSQKKRNVNWHSPIHNYAVATQEKQQQTSPQAISSTTTSSETSTPNNPITSGGNAFSSSNSSVSHSNKASPTKTVRIDECVREFYDDLINRTDEIPTPVTLNAAAVSIASGDIDDHHHDGLATRRNRHIGEDDGFESLNGKSSSGEESHTAISTSALPTTSTAFVNNQLRLRVNTVDCQPSILQDINRTETELKPLSTGYRRKFPLSSESDFDKQRNVETYQQVKKPQSRIAQESTDETEEEGDDGETISSPTSFGGSNSNYNECTTSATEWLGITTNSEECSYSSELENSDYKNPAISDEDYCMDADFAPTVLNPHSTDRISCTIWEQREIKKAQMSVLEISSCIIERVESMPETKDYIYFGVCFSILLSLIPCFCRLCEVTIDAENTSDISYLELPMLLWQKASFSFYTIFRFAFGHTKWERTVLIIGLMQRLVLTFILFIIFAVAERTFKQRFLYAKLFSHLTSSRRARKSNLPHFRLNKVRNIKTWLSIRSYLKRRGPQRSVDIIVSAAFIVTLLLLAFLSVEWLKDSVHLHTQLNLEALLWSAAIGIFLLRFMTLGNKIHAKYRSISVLITEQINLYLQIEQKPKKKDELMVSNSVLKLAADLLKELESPFKISGLSANPYLFTTIKVVILSALSGVLSEMLGFKLKLHKIKIK